MYKNVSWVNSGGDSFGHFEMWVPWKKSGKHCLSCWFKYPSGIYRLCSLSDSRNQLRFYRFPFQSLFTSAPLFERYWKVFCMSSFSYRFLSVLMWTCSQFYPPSVCPLVCVCLGVLVPPAPGDMARCGRSPLWCHFPFLSGYSQHSPASRRELWELKAGSLAP